MYRNIVFSKNALAWELLNKGENCSFNINKKYIFVATIFKTHITQRESVGLIEPEVIGSNPIVR